MCGVSHPFIDDGKYYEFWKDKVDEVALTDYEERKDTYNNEPSNIETPCSRLWQRLYIWWDGRLSPCDVDYLNVIDLGRIGTENSIKDTWNDNKLMEIRKMHSCGKRFETEPCARCMYS
jgi:radical SAM protein with 4Fe4S-binding SPASM domain